MVQRRVETVRTDREAAGPEASAGAVPDAFRNEPYQEAVRETIDKLMALDARLACCGSTANIAYVPGLPPPPGR